MELIRPSVEIWEQGNTLEDMWKHIARCTRVCYQSTPKNDGETDEEFVKRVILRTDSSMGRLNFDKIHGAMLEHGTVYLKLEVDYSDVDYNTIDLFYEQNPYSKVYHEHGICYITTNLRVIYESGCLDDLKYICSPTEYHSKRVTVSFTTNIGVSREFNRHRVNSMAEESTRYCNYTKRNDGSVKFTLPAWLLGENNSYIKHHEDSPINYYCEDIFDKTAENWCDVDYYLFALKACEFAYNGLIDKGWKPQQAREVLPLATKTQLIHTAFVDDWFHFFKLRAFGVSGPPHPNAKLVAQPLYEEFINKGYIQKY